MAKCLLCQEPTKERQLFSEIFFIRKKNDSLCADCQAQFEPISEQVCQFCCKNCQDEICQDCRYWQSQGKSVDHRALYHYNDKMMNYFSLYKFHGDYCLRKVFANQVKLALSQMKGFTIVPIPVSPERMKERGFNQVTAILDAAGLAYSPLLKKENSPKQSEKNREERLKTKQVFYYIEEKPQQAEKILLVDDIYTTGATLQLAKAILMKNGAKIVKTFSITR